MQTFDSTKKENTRYFVYSPNEIMVKQGEFKNEHGLTEIHIRKYDITPNILADLGENIRCGIVYGSAYENDSKDVDFIYAPLEFCKMLPADKWEIVNYTQCDFITKSKLSKNTLIRSFAYYNLLEDYGKEIADMWFQALKLEPIFEIKDFLQRNVQNWRKAFERTLHPIIFAKYLFAEIQVYVYEHYLRFINRKRLILEYAKKHFPKKYKFLWKIWREGTIFSSEFENAAEVVVIFDENVIEISGYGRSASYGVEEAISVWSATPEEIGRIYKELKENWQEEIQINVKKNITPSIGPSDIEHSLMYWDGYGL